MTDDTRPADDLAELRERVARLERRLDEQAAAPASGPSASGPSADARPAAAEPAAPATFWALDTLREQAPASGAVLYTGSVGLPTGIRAEWQYALTTDAILERDWSQSGASASLAALGNPVRLQILQAVANGTGSVAALTEIEGLGTTGQIYHHVNHLVAAGWLHSPTRAHYAIPTERIVPLLTVILASGAF